MRNHERLEIVITTVAGFYGMEWRELWRKRQKLGHAKRNLIKLIADYGSVSHLHYLALVDVTHFTTGAIHYHLEKCHDVDYFKLRKLIEEQFKIREYKAAS